MIIDWLIWVYVQGLPGPSGVENIALWAGPHTALYALLDIVLQIGGLVERPP